MEGEGSLKVECLERGWMYTASLEDGIYFQIGVERDEVAAWRRGREVLAHLLERKREDWT